MPLSTFAYATHAVDLHKALFPCRDSACSNASFTGAAVDKAFGNLGQVRRLDVGQDGHGNAGQCGRVNVGQDGHGNAGQCGRVYVEQGRYCNAGQCGCVNVGPGGHGNGCVNVGQGGR